LGHNSSRVIRVSTNSNPVLNSFLNIFGAGLKDTSDFTVSRFGNFTATFEKIPPPLPPEYWATLFTVIITSLVGSWFIPTAISWFKSKKQYEILHKHIETIDSLNNSSDKPYKNKENSILFKIQKKITEAYEEGKLKDGNYLKDLDYIKTQITDAYAAGKLNELQYEILDKKLSTCYQQRFTETLASLNGKLDLDDIKNDVASAYAEGKINEIHYNLLNKKILDYETGKESMDRKLSYSEKVATISTGQGSPIKINK
jgi:hypothetical protein